MSDTSPQWNAPAVPIVSAIASEEKAGFWLRFVANICDGIMVSLFSLPFAILSASTKGNISSLSQAAQFIFTFFLLAYWIGNAGGSPLRRKLGVFILDETDGSFIGIRRGSIRIMMSWVSAFVFLYGYWSMVWNPQKQTWHDRVANTVVVKR
ncbi:unannotated protein [freshwater metagenome]|uniref:Unannotated protein n=1 Tax=freshwater metagenome TaxID=449393 RepID=A0A6J6GAL5_9ZZZZ|nr:hypothetical protein [Actinomycetota bacterium]